MEKVIRFRAFKYARAEELKENKYPKDLVEKILRGDKHDR